MKKTRITVTYEINDTDNAFGFVCRFIENLSGSGFDRGITISKNCDDGSIVFSTSEKAGVAKIFSFIDFAKFVEKYVKNVDSYELVHTLNEYYVIDSVKAETLDIDDIENKGESKEAENAQ